MEIEEPPGDIVEPSVTVVDICDPRPSTPALN